MHILLINPPFSRFYELEQEYVPLSLLAVGSWLKYMDGSVKVTIKNFEIDRRRCAYKGYSERIFRYERYVDNVKSEIWDEVEEYIKKEKPDQIGITVKNAMYASAIKIIKIALRYDIPVIVGGLHPTYFPSHYDKFDNVKVHRGYFEDLPSGKYCLDSLPLPDYDMLVDTYKYRDSYGHIITSRGCPFKCKFCSTRLIGGRSVCYKSADYIIKEMSYIKSLFNNNVFTIWDDVFTLNKKRLFDFCTKYTIDAEWICESRANVLNEEMVKVMADSGCIEINVGVESAKNKILSYIGKGEKIEDYVQVAEIFKKYNMKWKAYVIIGFPEETIDDILETVSFVMEDLCPSKITLSIFTPYPGTELYEDCRKKGLIEDLSKDKEMLSLYSHQSGFNYFTPEISREDWKIWRGIISKKIDLYNEGMQENNRET